MRAVLEQTAAVVEGTVGDIRFEYDEVRGPRTVTTLTDLRVHLGALGGRPSEIRLFSFGGPLPNGKTIEEVHVPTFRQGQRALVFVRNTSWFLSPVVGPMALSVESVGGQPVVVTGAGAVVTGVDASGVRTGAVLFPLNPDGTRGYDTPPPTTGGIRQGIGPGELAAAVRDFAQEAGIVIAGAFRPAPTPHGPRWNVISVARAAPAPRPDGGRSGFVAPPAVSDSDVSHAGHHEEGSDHGKP